MSNDLPDKFKDQLYHIVVRGNELVMPVLYMPRIQQILSGKPQLTKGGHKMLEINSDFAVTSYTRLVEKFQSIQSTRSTMDSDIVVACDALKRFLNNNPCMLWFHREEKDSDCTVGNHLHIIYWNSGKSTPIFRLTSYRNLRSKIMAVEGQRIYQQKVKTTGMFIYMNSGNAIAKMQQTENARIFMGSTNMELLRYNADFHPSKMKQAYLKWKASWVTEIAENVQDDLDCGLSEEGLFDAFGLNAPVKSTMTPDGTLTKGQSYSNKKWENDTIDLDTTVTENEIAILGAPANVQLAQQISTAGFKRKPTFASAGDEALYKRINGMVVQPKRQKLTDLRKDALVSMFENYSVQNFKSLYKTVCEAKDKNAIDVLTGIGKLSVSAFSTYWNEALTEFNSKPQNQIVLPLNILYQKSEQVVHKWHLGVFETMKSLDEWCLEQEEDTFEFCATVYAICMKMFPKRNCLLLEGVLNDGRKYWIDCILRPIREFVANVGIETHFRWKCLQQKAVANCEKFGYLSKEAVNEFKQIAGGQQCSINVRNGAPVLLERTPIIIQSNQAICRFVPEDEEAIMNRCIKYSFDKPTTVLKNERKNGYPNSLLFKYMFEFFGSEGLNGIEVDNETQYVFKKDSDVTSKNALAEFATWIYKKMIDAEELTQKEEDGYWQFMEK